VLSRHCQLAAAGGGDTVLLDQVLLLQLASCHDCKLQCCSRMTHTTARADDVPCPASGHMNSGYDSYSES